MWSKTSCPFLFFTETLVKLVKDNPDYSIWVPTPKKVNLLTVNWQLFQVDKLIAPTPAANLRWTVLHKVKTRRTEPNNMSLTIEI